MKRSNTGTARLFTGTLLALSLAAVNLATPARAQMDDVQITAAEVSDGIYMLTGRGGNIGLSVGDDATFIIDDQFAPLTDRIIAAIAEVSDRPVDYVLNTHWHYDHTGGNENFGQRGALIMAHDNVHKRMEAGQVMKSSGRVVEPAPKIALPVVTFNDALTLHVNGQTITGTHIHHAHTDGDVIVYFKEGNVVHMGDTFFNRAYPFVDIGSGGNINGVIEAAATVLKLADADTRIIPGHGPLADKADLQAYHDRLVAIRDRIATMVDAGRSLQEIQDAKPTADFDGDVDPNGFISPEKLVGFVYESLSQ